MLTQKLLCTVAHRRGVADYSVPSTRGRPALVQTIRPESTNRLPVPRAVRGVGSPVSIRRHVDAAVNGGNSCDRRSPLAWPQAAISGATHRLPQACENGFVQMAIRGQNAAIFGQRAAVREIERLAVEVGDSAAGFCRSRSSRPPGPRFFRGSRAATAKAAAAARRPSPAASTAYFAWLSMATGGWADLQRCVRAGRFRRCSCAPSRPIAAAWQRRSASATKRVAAANRLCRLSGCAHVPRPRTAAINMPPPSGSDSNDSESSGQPSTPSSTWPSRTSASATAYCSRRKKALRAVDRVERPKCRRRLAAAAVDQAAHFFRRGIGNRRADELRHLVERRDAFFQSQASRPVLRR